MIWEGAALEGEGGSGSRGELGNWGIDVVREWMDGWRERESSTSTVY